MDLAEAKPPSATLDLVQVDPITTRDLHEPKADMDDDDDGLAGAVDVCSDTMQQDPSAKTGTFSHQAQRI